MSRKDPRKHPEAEGHADPQEYEVGYKRPPRSTRFKPGQSGNPGGRRKGSRNFTTALETELNARISIMENGIRKTLSKREVIAKRVVNGSVAGDYSAIKVVLAQEQHRELAQLQDQDEARALRQPDHKVLMSFRQRLLEMEGMPVIDPDDKDQSYRSSQRTKTSADVPQTIPPSPKRTSSRDALSGEDGERDSNVTHSIGGKR